MPRLASAHLVPDPDAPPYLLPEEGDRTLFKHCVHDLLTNNLDFHRAIRRTLTGAGFRVTRIRKHDFHDCWEIRLERSPSMFDDSYAQIRRRIRRALRVEMIYSKFEGMEVGFQGNRLVVGFCSKFGAVGCV